MPNLSFSFYIFEIFTCFYHRYLHEYIRDHNLGGRFFFMSPGLLAIETGKANDQVQALAERLETAQENHLVFTPYWDGYGLHY